MHTRRMPKKSPAALPTRRGQGLNQHKQSL
nr:MAG TPA: hypothetical protein [Caudoviricetes sp.]DAW38984.1 MAG TPA: hypothetical protein [Caudoviricetes sp.]